MNPVVEGSADKDTVKASNQHGRAPAGFRSSTTTAPSPVAENTRGPTVTQPAPGWAVASSRVFSPTSGLAATTSFGLGSPASGCRP